MMEDFREKVAPMIVSTNQHARSDEEKQDGEEALEPGNRQAVGQTHTQRRCEDAGADNARKRRAPGGHLGQQALPLTTGRECHDAEVIPLATEHTQCALTDRAGRAQYGDSARAAVRAVTHPGMPKMV